MRLCLVSDLSVSLDSVKRGFNRDLFLKLTPPGLRLDVLRFDGCRVGDEIHLVIRSLGMKQHWISLITDENSATAEWSFVDQGKRLPWPLLSWKHYHRVVTLDGKTSKIIDDVNFECIRSWMNVFLYPVLWFFFATRPMRYRKYFEVSR